jgi:hypothetical protein
MQRRTGSGSIYIGSGIYIDFFLQDIKKYVQKLPMADPIKGASGRARAFMQLGKPR